MLVIDANVAVAACAEEKGFAELGDELSAPPLMWSEARANLHLELFKQAITAEDAAIMHNVLKGARSDDKIRRSLAAERGIWPSSLAGDVPTTPNTSRSPRSSAVAL